jgi:hypothetical protein
VDAAEAKSEDKAKTQADVGSSNEDDDTPLDVPCTAVIKGEVPMFVEAPEVGDDDGCHGPPGSLPMVRTWSVDMSEEPVELEALDHDVRLVMRQHSQMSVFLYSIAIGDRNDGTTGNDGKAGDDGKAEAFLGLSAGLPVHPVPTGRLEELIGALSLCDLMICSDGGAMHLAAALGKPIVALFGDSDPSHWGPWKTPHTVLQKPQREVTEISVDEVEAEILKLAGESGFTGGLR